MTTPTTPPRVPPRWRRRLARFVRRCAAKLDPVHSERERMLDKAAQSYFRELKAAWRALDDKTREIIRLRQEVWKLGHPYGGTHAE